MKRLKNVHAGQQGFQSVRLVACCEASLKPARKGQPPQQTYRYRVLIDSVDVYTTLWDEDPLVPLAHAVGALRRLSDHVEAARLSPC